MRILYSVFDHAHLLFPNSLRSPSLLFPLTLCPCPHQGQVLLPNCCQMCPSLEAQSTYQRLYKLSENSTLSSSPAENCQWSLVWGSNLIPNLYLHAWILSGLNLHRFCVWFIHVVSLYVQLPCCVRKCGFVAVIHQLWLISFFLPFFLK